MSFIPAIALRLGMISKRELRLSVKGHSSVSLTLYSPHASNLVKNASSSLWTLYYSFAFEDLLCIMCTYIACYYSTVLVTAVLFMLLINNRLLLHEA